MSAGTEQFCFNICVDGKDGQRVYDGCGERDEEEEEPADEEAEGQYEVLKDCVMSKHGDKKKEKGYSDGEAARLEWALMCIIVY